MTNLLNWIKAILVVLVLVASMYAIWLLAIILTIGGGVYLLKSMLEEDTEVP